MSDREHLIEMVDAAHEHAEASGNMHAAYLLAGVWIALVEGTEAKLAVGCTDAMEAVAIDAGMECGDPLPPPLDPERN